MPRIAVFSLTYPPFVGGAEVAIQRIAQALQATHQCTVFTARLQRSNPSREPLRHGVIIVRVGFGWRFDKYLYPWLAVRAAAAEQRRQPFAMIWGMMASWGGLAALRFKERCPQLPYVLSEQSGDSDWFIARRTWFWSWRYQQIYRRANAVTAISRWLADRAKRFGAREVAIVPNGVDAAHFGRPVPNAEREAWQRRLDLPAGVPVVVTVSRLVHKNAVDDLIAAVAQLKRRGVRMLLVIAGVGPLAARLRTLAERLGVAEAVRFAGHVNHAKLPALMAVGDVFARPSRTEGFGNAFIEAMAAGLPVVATPVGGIPDFIIDQQSGLLVPPNDPAALAAALARLGTDHALRGQLISSGRAVARRYDWSVIAELMGNVFQRVLHP